VIELRAATSDDVDFMWQMLFYASHSDHEDGTTLDDIKKDPDLIRHLVGWASAMATLDSLPSTAPASSAFRSVQPGSVG